MHETVSYANTLCYTYRVGVVKILVHFGCLHSLSRASKGVSAALFVAKYIVAQKQFVDYMHYFIWRQKLYESGITASQAKDPKSLGKYVRKDKEYRFKKNVRGSPPYYQRTFYELLAMVRQLGTPTWLFTVSAADLKWSDMIHVIARQFGKFYKTDKEIDQLPLRNAVI